MEFRGGTAAASLLERKPMLNFSTFQCSTNKEAERIVHKVYFSLQL